MHYIHFEQQLPPKISCEYPLFWFMRISWEHHQQCVQHPMSFHGGARDERWNCSHLQPFVKLNGSDQEASPANFLGHHKWFDLHLLGIFMDLHSNWLVEFQKYAFVFYHRNGRILPVDSNSLEGFEPHEPEGLSCLPVSSCLIRWNWQ